MASTGHSRDNAGQEKLRPSRLRSPLLRGKKQFSPSPGLISMNSMRRCNGQRAAARIFHAADGAHQIALGMHAFDTIPEAEAVLDFNFHQTALCIKAGCIAGILAAVGFGMTAQVILVFGIVMALVETIGVPAVRKVFEFAQQAGIKGAAGNRIVDGLAIGLAGAGDVVGALGPAFDLQ